MKSYDEIANSVFERRDKYTATQKRKKRIIISIVTPVVCCGIVLTAGFGLWRNGFFNSNIHTSSSKPDLSDSSAGNSSNSNQSSSEIGSNSSQGNNSSVNPSNNSSSRDDFIPDNSSSSKPVEQIPSEPSDDASSGNVPSNPPLITETDYFIDSIDKINFYSAKKIINEKSLLPTVMSRNALSVPNIITLNNIYSEYPIDRNRIFTATMVTYFTIELNDEKGFLAQKLGGTGIVEVVVTENDIEEMGQMITFKRNEKYYTCFMNGSNYDPDSNKNSYEFSSHKYINGFNIIKNLEQENYKFTVYYDGSRVVGFECAPFKSTPANYVADDVIFIEDFCVVIYAKQTFTIDELEIYFKNENAGESL